MRDPNGHIDSDTLAAHAMDALTADEVVEVGQHLATCARCQQEVASLRAVAALLPYGLPDVEPPPDLRGRIVARAQASDPGAANATRVPVTSRERRSRWSWLPRLAPALAVLALVAGFLLGRNWPLDPATNLAGRPDAQTVTLTGQGGGTFVVAPGAGRVRLSVLGLPPLEQGRVYQLWLLKDNTPVSAGTFTVDAQGRGTLEIMGYAWSPGYNAVAVTAEPPGGSAGPTSDIVAQGNLR